MSRLPRFWVFIRPEVIPGQPPYSHGPSWTWATPAALLRTPGQGWVGISDLWDSPGLALTWPHPIRISPGSWGLAPLQGGGGGVVGLWGGVGGWEDGHGWRLGVWLGGGNLLLRHFGLTPDERTFQKPHGDGLVVLRPSELPGTFPSLFF